jgi:hypothetical protein
MNFSPGSVSQEYMRRAITRSECKRLITTVSNSAWGAGTPFSAHNTLHFRQESCTFGDFRATAGYHVGSISKIHPERALASASIRVLTSLASL